MELQVELDFKTPDVMDQVDRMVDEQFSEDAADFPLELEDREDFRDLVKKALRKYIKHDEQITVCFNIDQGTAEVKPL